MEREKVERLLKQVANGTVSVSDAMLKLKEAPFEDLGFAKLDFHRGLRQGAAEVIYGAGKTPEQISKKIATLTKKMTLAAKNRDFDLAILLRDEIKALEQSLK